MLPARLTAGVPRAGRRALFYQNARLGLISAGARANRYFAGGATNASPAQFCEQAIASAPVVVFSRSWCPFCKQVKTLFETVISPDLRVANIGASLSSSNRRGVTLHTPHPASRLCWPLTECPTAVHLRSQWTWTSWWTAMLCRTT